MDRKIKQVYVGLPSNLEKHILWVADKYRRNPLSLIAGGTDVVVEYYSEEIFGYNKIKDPANYIDAIFENYFERHGFDYNKSSIFRAIKNN